MKRLIVSLALVLIWTSESMAADVSAVCGAADSYGASLCRYHRGELEAAAEGFAEVVEAGEPRPETIRALYFLARTRMRQKRFDEAAEHLIKIYSLYPAFYKEWGCDFLLGVCRRAQGLD